MWNMFEGLNDWRIVETSAKSNDEKDIENVERTILRKRELQMSTVTVYYEHTMRFILFCFVAASASPFVSN